jgi:uncharacterized protein (DUF1499 family)
MQKSRWNWLSWLAFVVAVCAIGLLGLAGPGYRLGWFSLGTALQRMLAWAAYAGIAAGVLALLALALNGRRGGTSGRMAALLALVVGLGSIYVPWQWQRQARRVPPIHDISTDTIAPPVYVEVAAVRQEQRAPNGLEYSDAVAAQQRAGYPDLAPAFLAASPDEAYRKALDLVRARGWEVVAADDAGRRIEATDRTFWFGFKDDVAIRVSAIPDGSSRVDIRSVSRVGRSDVGTNAARIRAFLTDLGK